MKDYILFIIGVLLLCAGCYFLGVVHGNASAENDSVDTITIHDTISDLKPYSVIIHHYDTLEYFQCDTIWENGEIVLIEDTIQMPVPISKSIYIDTLKTDTTKFSYRMLVEGYNVAIDSLSYHFEYNPSATQKKTPSRWSFGVQLGYGITPKGFQPYIGVGLGYRLF